ncbi:MAG: peptidase M48 Ste24p, partial [Deltaproteobacteria bacterium]|nr:peptidase M48 Ste24p [Deltaproteobacteria bacterium]
LYEKLLEQDRKQAGVLNNLAWILLTTDDPDIRDIKRGFALAKEAVELERLPEFLDTLAEAYWANGNNEMAVQLEKEAIMRDKKNNPHYRKQLEKFLNVKRTNI